MLRRLVLLALVSIAAPLGATESVALVTELAGSGTLLARPQTPLELLQDLAPGARVSLAQSARATIVHTATGVVYELAGPGVFRVQARAIEGADAKARVTRRELPPEIRAYKLNPAVAAQASIVLRSGAANLEGPDGGVLSEDELRYRIPGDLRQPRFEVLDDTGLSVVLIEQPDRDVDLKDRHAWVPGRPYRVQVSGLDRSGRAAVLAARFTVMAPDAVERLQRGKPASARATTDWIVYALALESAGANASARTIWRALYAAR